MIRLVKVIVQPVLVADDGENLREVKVGPTEVPADVWPGYATTQFPEALAELEALLGEQDGSVTSREKRKN